MITKVNNTVLDLENPAVDALDMGGNVITNHGIPVNASDVATKLYADTAAGSGVFLPLAGGIMAGQVDMAFNTLIGVPNPTTPFEAANKAYTDTFLPLAGTSGGAMSGEIDMNMFAIINLPSPGGPNAAATKDYVDNAVGAGNIVQIVHTPFSDAILSPFNPQYPGDDTKPQQTLDTGFLLTAFNTTITPTSATNRLKIEFVLNWSITGLNTSVFFAVFQDATEDALVVTQDNDYPAANFSNATTLTFYMLAGTTSPTTFKIGYGQAGSAGTVTINGIGGARRFGGALISHMTVTEINA